MHGFLEAYAFPFIDIMHALTRFARKIVLVAI